MTYTDRRCSHLRHITNRGSETGKTLCYDTKESRHAAETTVQLTFFFHCVFPFLKAAGHSFASLFLVAEKIGGRGTSNRNSPHSNNGGQVQPDRGTGMTWGRASATTNSRLFTEPLPHKPAPTVVQTHSPTPSRWRTAYSPDSQGDNHGEIKPMEIHQAHRMGQRPQGPGTVPHLRTTNRLLLATIKL